MRRKCLCLVGVWLAFAAGCGKQDVPARVGPPVAEKKEDSIAEVKGKQDVPARVAPPVAEKKEDSTGAANSTKQELEVLDAEQARKALLDMIDAGGFRADSAELLAILRQRLQTAKVKEADVDTVRLGKWHCNLKTRTFFISFEGAGVLNDYSGAFDWSNDAWRASVKEKRCYILPK